MEDLIIQVSKSELFNIIGGASVVIIGLSVWISSIITERLKQKWQKKTAIDIEVLKQESMREIEALKGEIVKNNSIINTVLNQHGQANQKMLEKRIDAAQKAWDKVLKLKAVVPAMISLSYDIVLDTEIENGFLDKPNTRGETFGSELSTISMIDFVSKQNPINEEIKALRPFLNEKLSLLLFIYGGVLGRMVFYLTDTYKKGSPKPWRHDSGIKQLLEFVLEKREIEYIYQHIQTLTYSTVVDLLETKIINEINLMLSGSKLIDDTVFQAEKIHKLLVNSKDKAIVPNT